MGYTLLTIEVLCTVAHMVQVKKTYRQQLNQQGISCEQDNIYGCYFVLAPNVKEHQQIIITVLRFIEALLNRVIYYQYLLSPGSCLKTRLCLNYDSISPAFLMTTIGLRVSQKNVIREYKY